MKKNTLIQTRLTSLNTSQFTKKGSTKQSPFDDALKGLGISIKKKENPKSKDKKEAVGQL